jgi:hypothetical protein
LFRIERLFRFNQFVRLVSMMYLHEANDFRHRLMRHRTSIKTFKPLEDSSSCFCGYIPGISSNGRVKSGSSL